MNFYSIKEKLFFYNFPVILFSFIPFFLITGPFLSDLAISVIGLIFLIYCFKKKNFSFFKNKFFYLFLLFWAYLIFNTFITNFNLDSLKISFFYFRYGIFVIAILAFLNFDTNFIKYFFFCTLICFMVLIIDGFYQYFFGENILGWKKSELERTSSFFGDERILGSYLSRLWPIFFGLSILIFKYKHKLFSLFIFIFILSEVLIFLSGDRAAFFYINLSAVFIILLSKNLSKLRLFTLLFSIFLIGVVSFFNPTAKERVFDKTFNEMNLNKQNDIDEVYIFTKLHNDIYISSFKIFLDNKLLGVGVKNFRNICSDPKYYVDGKNVCNTHPHNTYIQVLSEIGILGFLFLITVLFYFCKYLLKHFLLRLDGKYYFNDFEICILSGIAIYLWPFVPTGNVFNNWLNIIMILNLPFLIWSRKSNKF